MKGEQKVIYSGLFHTSYLILHTSFLLPLTASAQQSPIRIFNTPNASLNFTTFANKLVGISNSIIPFLIGVAFVVIVWGIFKYVMHAGDSEKVAEGRRSVVYGILALFLMLSFWGFVMIIAKSLFGTT